jgi:hypothetical protein
MACKIKKFLDEYGKKWENGVDKVFDAASAGVEHLNDKYDPNNLLTVSKAQKDLHNVIKDYEIESNHIYTNASELKVQLGKLDKADGENIVRALNGDLDPFELSDNHKAVYDKFRTVIDKNAQDLVNAGALAEKNMIGDYLKRYYAAHLEKRNAIQKMFFNKRFKERKNLTYDERIALGMVEDASFVIPQTIAEQKSQLLKANTLKAIADQFAKEEEFEGSILVPDTTMGGGIKKYGALSGKHVRKDIFDAVNDAHLAGDVMNGLARGWMQLIDHIKVNVTVKNPTTHLYNIGSNILLAGLNGDLVSLGEVMHMAAADKAGFDALLQRANNHGLNSSRNDFENVSAVLENDKPNVLKSIFKNLYLTQDSKAGTAIRNLYDWEDKIFKLAAFKKLLDAGMDEREAYNKASEVYVDYSTPLPGAVKFVDKSGVLPFLHYVYKSTPATAKVIAKNPIKYLVLQTALAGMGASLLFNESEDDYKPEWAGNKANLFGVKEWADVGNGWYLNAGRMIPGMKFGGLNFDTNVDTNLGFGFVGSFVQIAGGKTPLGYNIASKYDSTLEVVQKKMLTAAENFLPPISFGRYGQRTAEIALGNAGVIEQKKNYYDEPMTVAELAGRSLGARRFNEAKEIQGKANAANSERKHKIKMDEEDPNISVSDRFKNKRITEQQYKERMEKLKKSARAKKLNLNDKAQSSSTKFFKTMPKFKL